MNAKEIRNAVVIFSGIGVYAWCSLPPATFQSAQERQSIESSIQYSGCKEVRSAGKAPIYAGEPGYSSDMDGDADGIACEPIR